MDRTPGVLTLEPRSPTLHQWSSRRTPFIRRRPTGSPWKDVPDRARARGTRTRTRYRRVLPRVRSQILPPRRVPGLYRDVWGGTGSTPGIPTTELKRHGLKRVVCYLDFYHKWRTQTTSLIYLIIMGVDDDSVTSGTRFLERFEKCTKLGGLGVSRPSTTVKTRCLLL